MNKHKTFTATLIFLMAQAFVVDSSFGEDRNNIELKASEHYIGQGADACNTLESANEIIVGSSHSPDVINFRHLGQALDFARHSASNDIIKVAAGRYSPSDEGLEVYVVPDGVHLQSTGHGRTTFNSESGRLFILDSGAKVSFDGFHFKGGSALGASSGDANNDDGLRGGAIFSENSDLTVCNSHFSDNHSRKFGGAIFQNGGQLRILRSQFNRNTVLKGFQLVHDQLSDLETDGGAVAVINTDLIVRESSFKFNTAGDDGGAIAVQFSNVEISDSRFVGNKAIAALLPASTTLVTRDFATGFGGAVSIQNEAIGGDQSRLVTMIGNTFIKNQSAVAGGVYLTASPGSQSVVKHNVFIQNGGSGQLMPNAPPEEQGVRFGMGAGALCLVGLRALDTDRDEAGNLLRGKHVARSEGNYFINNRAGYGAGLVAIGLDLESVNDIYYKNIAKTRGGAIWSQNFLPLFSVFSGLPPERGVISIRNGIYIGNRVTGTLEPLQFEVFPELISEPEQPTGGGAIANDQAGIIEIRDSLFVNNSATNYDGGALHNATSPVSTLSGISGATYGGLMTVVNSYFLGNRSNGGSGGAISAGGNASGGAITNASGEDVRATAVEASTIVKSSLFSGNSADRFGGAIANWNAGALTLEDSSIRFNSADVGGGVSSIGVADNPSKLSIQNTSLRQNRARSGSNNLFTENVQE